MNPLRWLRARRLARLEAEITAVYVDAWAVIAEQRDRDNATHDLLDPEQAPATR